MLLIENGLSCYLLSPHLKFVYQRLSMEDRLLVLNSLDFLGFHVHFCDFFDEITRFSERDIITLLQEVLTRKETFDANESTGGSFDERICALVLFSVMHCLGCLHDTCMRENIKVNDNYLYEYPNMDSSIQSRVNFISHCKSSLEFINEAISNLERLLSLKVSSRGLSEDVVAVTDILSEHMLQVQNILMQFMNDLLKCRRANYSCSHIYFDKILLMARKTGNLSMCVMLYSEPSNLREDYRLSTLFIILSEIMQYNSDLRPNDGAKSGSSSPLRANEVSRYADFTRILDVCIAPLCTSISLCPKLPHGNVSLLPRNERLAMQMLVRILYLWSIVGYSDFKLEGWITSVVIHVIDSQSTSPRTKDRLRVVCYLLHFLLVSSVSSKQKVSSILFQEHEQESIILRGQKVSLALEEIHYDRIKSIQLSTVLIAQLVLRALQ